MSIGELGLAEPGESPDVDEQHRGDRARRRPLRCRSATPAPARLRAQQARDRQRRGRADLAGEPHVRLGARCGAAAAARPRPARQGSTPATIRTRQVEQRALPPQTERCGTPWARLISKQRRAGRRPHLRAADIGDRDFAQAAQGRAAHRERREHHRGGAVDRDESRHARLRPPPRAPPATAPAPLRRRRESGRVGEPRHLPTRRHGAGDRGGRDQRRDAASRWDARDTSLRRAANNGGRGNRAARPPAQQDLPGHPVRPEQREDRGIGRRRPGRARPDPRFEEMRGEEERDQKAGKPLHDFGPAEAQIANPGELDQRERAVGE